MKKLKIEIEFNDYGHGIEPILNAMHVAMKGHVPYIDSDIRLSTDVPYDGDKFSGDEAILVAKFREHDAAKNGIISDLIMAAMIAANHTIKEMEGGVSNES
jgi:hypothetical protein